MMANQMDQNAGRNQSESYIDPDDLPVGRHEQHRLATDVIDTLIKRC